MSEIMNKFSQNKLSGEFEVLASVIVNFGGTYDVYSTPAIPRGEEVTEESFMAYWMSTGASIWAARKEKLAEG